MTDLDLTIGCFLYDTTRALFDGSVGIEGVNVAMRTGPTLPDIFERMVRDREFDVAELGLTFYLRTLDDPGMEAAFVALPAFPNRVFRHSAVYVNVDAGIEKPSDLAGKIVGEFGLYGQDPGVWIKGILADEYGFDPLRSRWLVGDLDGAKLSFDFVPHPHPDELDIGTIPAGKTLGAMLETGEIDALFSANVPQCVLDGSPRVRRLFPDYEPLERDYYRRTGIFPIMHTVVIARDLLDAHPEIASKVYQAFLQSKEAAADRYRRARRLYQAPTMMPWMNPLVEENLALFSGDWWPYGIEANQTAVDTYLRYFHEQGLSPHRRSVEEVFVPELLGT